MPNIDKYNTRILHNQKDEMQPARPLAASLVLQKEASSRINIAKVIASMKTTSIYMI